MKRHVWLIIVTAPTSWAWPKAERQFLVPCATRAEARRRAKSHRQSYIVNGKPWYTYDIVKATYNV